MTCAKRVVKCVIHPLIGRPITGTNWCGSPREVCPRYSGEGYAKCKRLCHQEGHAEEVALSYAKRIGADLKGATAVVSGHYRVCKECSIKLADAGIAKIIIEVTR